MKNKFVPLAIIFALGLSAMACTVPISIATSQPDPNQVAIQVAQTVAAINAQTAQQHQTVATLAPAPTLAPLPTAMPLPFPTAIPLPTATVTPCNWATAVDVNYVDNTDVTHSTAFSKTWQFTNVGYCTWNTSYYLAFYSGNQMGGTSPTYLTSSVAPNGSINVTVTMTAPATAGTYTGYWHLYTNGGYDIGPVWVTIDVI
jgi:hypothetical protein